MTLLKKRPVKNYHVKTLPVIGSHISIVSFDEALQKIFDLATTQHSSYVCFANVHMVVEAFIDANFQKVVNSADLALADGIPLSKYLQIFEDMHLDRAAGPDMMPKIMERASREGKTVYFYGGTEQVLEKLCEKAQRNYPSLKIAGSYSPPFRQLNGEEEKAICDTINEADPDFLFVCLGCPKQEQWMHRHKHKINSCMLGVGQAFSIYAGLVKRSPRWMQKNGLEWAYRLYSEPRRLAKRYFYTNTIFLLLVISLYFKRLFQKNYTIS